ncbi:MAG: hypothetical protein RIR79_2361 [Pseudomonadota bacterium]|jgi:hypothetical protein
MKISPLAIRSFFIVIALNTVIAITLSIFDERGLGDNMVYSQCIGVCIWAMSYAPGHCWGWKIVPFSVLLGYVAGLALADTLLHNDALAYLLNQPFRFFGLLLVSLSAGVAMTWYFVNHTKLLEAERQVAESRLKLLESQLEPHMLFNTLANLHTLIAIDPQAAQTMLDHLTAYLRATLNASRTGTHTLENEFARLEDYLALMKIRMVHRLDYALHLPDDLRQHHIPTLLLQPLVENAIRHGLEPTIAGGRIDIRASQEGNRLCLQVVDTGQGFATHPNEKGFGLAQVRERLQTLYGKDGAMNLEATHAGGACVSVVIAL